MSRQALRDLVAPMLITATEIDRGCAELTSAGLASVEHDTLALREQRPPRR